MGSEEGEYVVFVGSLTVPAHNIWADAAIAYAEEYYPGLTLIADRFPVSEDQNLARQATLDIITTNPELDGIVAFGSQGAPGAAQALREKGLVGRIANIGTTAPSQAGQFLMDGSMSAAFLWDPAEAGYAAVYLAKTVLEGNRDQVDENFEIPTLGTPMVVDGNTVIFDRPLIVTAENVDEYSNF